MAFLASVVFVLPWEWRLEWGVGSGLQSPNQGCCWGLRGKSQPGLFPRLGSPCLSTGRMDAVQKTSLL